MRGYSCSFWLLLDRGSPSELRGTIESISAFATQSTRVSTETVQILCACTEESRYPAEAKPGVDVIDPRHWDLPGEREPFWGPDIVKLFGIASRRSRGELVIILSPGCVIRNVPALDSAISSVLQDHKRLLISHNPSKTPLPTSAVLADSSVGGAAGLAVNGSGIEATRRLFGGVSYRPCAKEMREDVPWLIAWMALAFEQDAMGVGRKFAISEWA